MHLRAGLLIDELRRMVPELQVAGGSFGHWMPHPRDVLRTERERVRNTAQRKATAKCLTDLLARVSLPAVEPDHLASGARKWPSGYTGSVSHKGATVVGVIVPTDRMTSIGIDIERLDGKHVPASQGLDLEKHAKSIMHSEARTIIFSAQEAAYKALHPILGQALDSSGVVVSWDRPGPVRSHGVARTQGVAIEVRCSVAVPSWVLSAALWPVTVAPGL